MAINLCIDETTYDLKLDDNNGLCLTSNNTEYVAQTITNRLKTFYQEWFLNRDLGIPYHEKVFQKQSNLNTVNALFVSEIVNTPGVAEIIDFRTVFDTIARRYRVNFTVRAITGEIIVRSTEL